jgi:hypothetical protein
MWAMTIDGQLPRCRVCREALPDELYRLQEHARCEPPGPEPSAFKLGQQVGRWLGEHVVAPRRDQRP